MLRVLWSVLLTASLVVCESASSLVDTQRDYHYCNRNPEEYAIVADPSEKRVKQIHIFIRHGSRVSIGTPLRSIFPGLNLAYNCSDVHIISQRQSGSDHTVRLTKKYPWNEEFLEGNCLEGQSVKSLYTQHRENGKHVLNTYKSQLWTDDEYQSMCECASSSICDDYFELISTDKERTVASAAVLIQSILNLTDSESMNRISIPLTTHWEEWDPWRAYSIDPEICNFEHWFKEMSEKTSPEYEELIQSDLYRWTKMEWNRQVPGSDFSPQTGNLLWPPLCYGLDLPITQELFDNATKINLKYHVSMHDNSGNFSMNATLLSNGPLFHQILNRINERKKLLVHSFHDVSLMFLYSSLSLDWTDEFPMFAEMSILEIYNDSFRWIRNGQWMESLWPECQNEYYNSKHEKKSELCSLSILTDYLSEYASEMSEFAQICANESTADDYGPKQSIGESQTDSNHGNKHDHFHSLDFLIGFMTGFLIAILIVCLIHSIQVSNFNIDYLKRKTTQVSGQLPKSGAHRIQSQDFSLSLDSSSLSDLDHL